MTGRHRESAPTLGSLCWVSSMEQKTMPDFHEPVDELPSKAIQIQAASLPGDFNSGPHVELFALCEDGSIWVQYHSSGGSNVPTDGRWYPTAKPHGERRIVTREMAADAGDPSLEGTEIIW